MGVIDSPGADGWRRILDQERIAHRRVAGPEAKVITASGVPPAWGEAYVATGGVLIVSGASEVPFDGGTRHPLTAISGFWTPATNRWCAAPTLATLFGGDGEGTARQHEDRLVKYGSDPDRFPVVLTSKTGNGAFVYTGIPLTDLLMAYGDRLRPFSEFTPITERVAAIDKADVADTLLHMLRLAFRLAALPMVRVARFPRGAPSVLILRVDVDGVYAPHTQELIDAAIHVALPASFFINAELCERYPGLPHSWPANFEVGQHARTHTLYQEVRENYDNLLGGQAWVEQYVGRPVTSFVAPRGMWNASLGQALAQIGYRCSSDFGLDFDSLPFRADSGVLQVPVHPYSPERALRWAEEQGVEGPTATETRDMYLAVLKRQLSLGRPMHVYGHPEVLGAMAREVVPAIAAFGRDRGVPALTLASYAEFWERREASTPRIRIDRSGDRVAIEGVEAATYIDVEISQAVQLRVGGEAAVRRPGLHRIPPHTDFSSRSRQVVRGGR